MVKHSRYERNKQYKLNNILIKQYVDGFFN